MTRTEWQDETTTLRERIDSFPTRTHPAISPLIRRLESLLQIGLAHEFITPKEAARA